MKIQNNHLILLAIVTSLIFLLSLTSKRENISCDRINFKLNNFIDSIETDPIFNMRLKKYIIYSMYDDNSINKFSDIFIRPSYEQVCLKILNDSVFYEWYYEIDDERDYDFDYRYNILRFCNNENIKYNIVNELLKHDNINGLICLWDNCDITRLPEYEKFLQKSNSINNYSKLFEMLAILHNNQYFIEEKKVKGMLRNFRQIDERIDSFIHFIEMNDSIEYTNFLFDFKW